MGFGSTTTLHSRQQAELEVSEKGECGGRGGERVDRRLGCTFMGLVAMRVTTSMTTWSEQPSLSALRLCAMEPAVVTSMPMSCTQHMLPPCNTLIKMTQSVLFSIIYLGPVRHVEGTDSHFASYTEIDSVT